MLGRLIPIFLFVLTITVCERSADAHEVKWINGTTYNYDVLLKGRDCCGGSECRPAFSYKPTRTGWALVIPREGLNPDLDRAKAVRISVEEMRVTYSDLGGDGVAHACGYFANDGSWTAYCTFIPRGTTASGKKWLDAALRLKRPALAGRLLFDCGMRL